ncbi:MAG: NifB/NifX family molybdenum-iron cluster-binding protein [Deltaproteobacteria bacterium]|nr:NifB/NifX family molybdenum-iron cluster-binding protein [Candidatus Zymogenaceae bacterium]
MKKIACAADDGGGLNAELSAHFGRCPYYVMVTVEKENITDVSVVENPHYENHQPGVMPRFISSLGADVIIAGGMGPRAVDLFHSLNIDVVSGIIGRVEDVVRAFLDGKIEGVVPCAHDHNESCQ